MSETDIENKWRMIETAWKRYCHKGATAFDWDYDSRELMRDLTGHGAFGDCADHAHAEDEKPTP